jgi:protein-tyrosine phosphatase
VRARSLDHVGPADWTAIHALGVRTLIDLRNHDERTNAPAPKGIATLHLPHDVADRDFLDEWASDWRFGTPVYYGPHLARYPERSRAVLEAIAGAPPGGVLFHCMGGRDRTGMIAMLVLSRVIAETAARA